MRGGWSGLWMADPGEARQALVVKDVAFSQK